MARLPKLAAALSEQDTRLSEVLRLSFAAPADREVDQRRADGTSSLEIGPAFFQPSRKSHVLG
jgi:hypothetical protein